MASKASAVLQLERILRDHPGEPMVLLVRSRPTGDQMLERLARAGLSWANVRVATPASLARDLATPLMARRGLKHATRTQTLFLVDRLLRSGRDGRWFLGRGADGSRQEPTDGLVRAVHRSVMELRRHGLDAAALSPQAFSPPAKGEALKEVLAAYEATLEALALVDTPGLLGLALQRLGEAPGEPGEGRTRYLIPAGLTFRGLERELVQRLTRGRIIPFSPGSGPPKELRFFHATSPETELRAVLRRVMAQGLPWDQVEVVATDLATYGPILHALAARLDLPVTYSDGLPLAQTTPGRGAFAYLEWVAEGFPASVLAGALAGGDLVPPVEPGPDVQTGAPGPGTSPQARGRLLAQKLLESPIGWGRARYQAWVDQVLNHQAVTPRPRRASDPVEEDLARFLRDLLLWTPDPQAQPEGSLPHLITALRRVVSRFTVERTPLDRGGRVALLRSLEGLEEVAARAAALAQAPAQGLAAWEAAVAGWEAPAGEPLARMAARLGRWLGELAVGQGEPRPGALHLASLEQGGYAGRPYLFVVGLDEGRFPGKGGQDPLLLDRDRASLPGDLPPAASRPTERRQSLEELVARAGGTVTCSFATRDPLQGQEVAPSAALLDLFRQAQKTPEADYSALREALGAPEGLVPRGAGGVLPLDRVEGWLGALRVGPPGGERLARPAGDTLERAFPFLAAGQRAGQARESLALTPYDGVVPPTPALDPRRTGEAVSAGRLESLATCPLQYFFRYVLAIRPPERPELDPDRWLDPLSRGSVLHDCYRRFWEERLQAGQAGRPMGDEDRTRMEAIALDVIAGAREQVPPPSEGVFERERQELVEEALFFVELEARRPGGGVPVLLERAFGMGREPAVVIDLGGKSGPSQRLHLQGRIDRVDRLPEGTYAVWDYKTGSARRYESQWTHFEGGRQLQHVLYAWAAEALLRREGLDPNPCVARSGYLMTTRRGRGHRADRPQDPARREEAKALLRQLLDVAAGGLFAPAPDAARTCEFCDYRQACQGPEAVRQVKAKAEAGEARLAFWREVRAHE